MSSLKRLRLIYHKCTYPSKYKISYLHIPIRYRSGSKAGGLVHNDSATSKWVGTYRRLPPIIYQIPFIIAFGFIVYVSFDWIGPYIKPDMFEEEERRSNEKLLLRIDQYLDWNSQRDDVITLESGLQFRKIDKSNKNKNKNNNRHPSLSDIVMIHYQGQYMDGQEFDNSIEKNRPVSVKLNTLIKGLQEGIQYMKEGDCFEFYIHPKMGYGYKSLDKLPGEQGIKPNSVLIYSVKLLKIIDNQNDYDKVDSDDVDEDAQIINVDKLF